MTPAPRFLTRAEIDLIHQDQIVRYGGSMGVRDGGLLDSAIAQPATQFAGTFLHSDLFEMAAAYLFHLTGNHPYLDGNKRVGIAAAIVFLSLNGFSLQCADDDLEAIVFQVARGELAKAQLADFFRTSSVKTT